MLVNGASGDVTQWAFDWMKLIDVSFHCKYQDSNAIVVSIVIIMGVKIAIIMSAKVTLFPKFLIKNKQAEQSFDTTVYPKKYAHGFCFAVLCCGYTLTDFPISIRLTSLALWQSNDCPSASKATLMNMDKYFMWIHYERLHNHNKAKHNKTVCIFLGIYCSRKYHGINILWSYTMMFFHSCNINAMHWGRHKPNAISPHWFR